MKRRLFLGSVATTTGATLSASAEVGEKKLTRSPVVIMAPRPDGIEAVWAVRALSRGWIEWRDSHGSSGTANVDRFGLRPQGDEILRVRLEGLQPGKDYHIRAVTESADRKVREEGPWKEFRTLDPAASKASFVVWNDTHQNEETLRQLQAKTPKGDFLIWNGDICNDWHQEDWLIPTLLNPADQDISNGHPLMLVWGNHDVRGQWAYRLNEMVATPDGRPFYAFRNGPVAVICLHTGEDKPDGHPSFGGRVAFEQLRAEQARWMETMIEQPEFRDAPYRVVCCHIPLRWKKERVIDEAGYRNGAYDSYSKMSRDQWHEALVKWKTQLIISGHMHQTAWIPGTKKFPYAQMVGGGPQPTRATWMEVSADAQKLAVLVKNLDGKIVEQAAFPPLT
jgi:predicted phosphodiesterase